MSLSSPRKRWKKSDALWLAIAVVAHLAILLAPISKPVPDNDDQALISVSLENFIKDINSEPVTELRETVEDLVEPEVIPPDDTEQDIAAIEEMSQSAPDEPPPELTEETVLPSAAQLIESISSVDFEQPEPAIARLLDRSSSVSIPHNWRAGAGTGNYMDNMFHGMTVPRSTEVVDRWRSADGSHNVVLNLPNGATVCGREAPPDPMRPMFVSQMMFRPCAGGGKRTFNIERSKFLSDMASNPGISR